MNRSAERVMCVVCACVSGGERECLALVFGCCVWRLCQLLCLAVVFGCCVWLFFDVDFCSIAGFLRTYWKCGRLVTFVVKREQIKHTRFVQILLFCVFLITQQNGLSALDIAKQRKHFAIVALLENFEPLKEPTVPVLEKPVTVSVDYEEKRPETTT